MNQFIQLRTHICAPLTQSWKRKNPEVELPFFDAFGCIVFLVEIDFL